MFFIVAMLVIGYFYLAELLKHKRVAENTEDRRAIRGEQSRKFADLMANLPDIIEQSERTYKQQAEIATKENLTPEQKAKVLKPLQDKLNQLYWVRDNAIWLQWAQPYIDTLLKSGLKWLK